MPRPCPPVKLPHAACPLHVGEACASSLERSVGEILRRDRSHETHGRPGGAALEDDVVHQLAHQEKPASAGRELIPRKLSGHGGVEAAPIIRDGHDDPGVGCLAVDPQLASCFVPAPVAGRVRSGLSDRKEDLGRGVDGTPKIGEERGYEPPNSTDSGGLVR